MKKVYALLLLIISTLSLSACDPSPYLYDLDELNDEIVSVELINYTNENQKSFMSWVPNHFSDLKPLDMSNITILETLSAEDLSSFTEELSEVYFLYEYYAYDSPKGISLKVNYSNGDFEILTSDYANGSFSGYVGRYNSEGEVVSFTGCFEGLPDFEHLVNSYFETELE
jgi:hypothetical protein